MRTKMDISQLKQLQQRMQRMYSSDVVDKHIRTILTELALRLLRKIKLATPVDTSLLRNSWQIGEITKIAGGYSIEVFNDVEYASFVEYGHRYGVHLEKWKGGRYMMTMSTQELEKQLPAIIGRKQKALLQRILGG